jgi:hypothetical protein
MKKRRSALSALATVLAAMADPVRLRILRLVLQHELCVCEVVDALQIPQHRVSRHLGSLAEARRDDLRLKRRLAMRQAGHCVVGTQGRSRPACSAPGAAPERKNWKRAKASSEP